MCNVPCDLMLLDPHLAVLKLTKSHTRKHVHTNMRDNIAYKYCVHVRDFVSFNSVGRPSSLEANDKIHTQKKKLGLCFVLL
jgi:hypothetical protein